MTETAIDNLAAIVRQLRSAAFRPEYAHERQWETEEEEQRREDRNKVARERWDAETEAMIQKARNA